MAPSTKSGIELNRQLPAYILSEPDHEYHAKAREYLSSHQLSDFRKCPALYQKKKLGLVAEKDRPAFKLGRAAHTLVLEGAERFEAEYAVGGPVNPRTGKRFGVASDAYKDWAAAQGKPVLTEEQADELRQLAASVRAHSRASRLIADGIPEGVVRTEYCGVQCQIRMDYFNSDAGIIDLKTCDDLSYFESDARRYSYLHQLAFYQAVFATVSGERMPVHFIAVEKTEPYRCGVWLIADTALDFARTENEAAIQRLKQCVAADTWPTGYEETRVFDSI